MTLPRFTRFWGALALVGLLGSSLSAAEKLKLASTFTDHAVLQRELAVPVWGKAEPGTKITVAFAGQEKTATADKDGKWSVKLDPLAASAEGRELSVKSESETAAIKDVLVGEVWVCSGQSNMAWTLSKSQGAEAAIKAAGDAKLRLFNASAKAVDAPADSIGGNWALDSAESAPNFSGVAYFFGKELRAKLDVPVGLIKSAVGGTPAEAWTPRADLEANPTLKPILEAHAKRFETYEADLANWKKREADIMKAYAAQVAKAKADGKPAPRKPQAPEHPASNVRRPYGLYNGSIAPLVPYAIRGAIWYQGEANSSRGREYQTLFPAMITGWRKAWAQGDFPFLFVQIAPHNGMSPEVREAQRLTVQTTQNTAMAVTIDVGNATDIHPTAKQPVGQRLALAARAVAYGEKITYSGPDYDAISVSGNKAMLSFKHVGSGLVAKGSQRAGAPAIPLAGFTIAGADEKFVDAKAEIVGDTVVVASDAVSAPVQVRYGWSNVPEGSLWNKDGLPASPFQSDKAWQLEDGFELLLNLKDLTGWHYANGPEFKDMLNASDGRYTARDGRIVVNPGKGLAQLWTTRDFPTDFHLKLEFRAGSNADSGIFLRKPQLQCRDYLVAGPYKELKTYKPQDWNEIEVIVKGKVATCTCNGEELKFPNELPATGPIGLEADRGQMEYRRIRIKELK